MYSTKRSNFLCAPSSVASKHLSFSCSCTGLSDSSFKAKEGLCFDFSFRKRSRLQSCLSDYCSLHSRLVAICFGSFGNVFIYFRPPTLGYLSDSTKLYSASLTGGRSQEESNETPASSVPLYPPFFFSPPSDSPTLRFSPQSLSLSTSPLPGMKQGLI